ncbi:PAS/PAC sensor signal transduction histidine kinase [Nitrosomonas sp. PY1]|uniref:sensor histidine kinase n=1 Tax=Nitrosomonas sp. PY1 TaxID=1803906 RepID=UPI001FC86CB2|nr:ATP-binding protein [Nitrosomonas sp. PY1]GKS68046.1 PAS/PAC sensor signal transduction histidine kinase [Nitrosomonas sp. PY1]
MTTDQQQLQIAFAAFNEASEQLSGVYQGLQHQVAQLTHELALANGELRKQLLEKENISNQLSFLLNALPGGVIALNTQGSIEQVNPAALQILGEPLLHLQWQDIVAQRLKPTKVMNEWYLQQDEEAKQQLRIRIQSSLMDCENRQILLLNDITESYAIQEKIRRNQRLTAMGEMAANLAHQLRTPLATALLYATHLGNDNLTPDVRKGFADKTIERLHRLEQLTKDMLRFVKGETTQLERFSISYLLSELQQVIEPQLKLHHMHLIVHDHSKEEYLVADYQALFGAMISLLENAMQASTADDLIILTSSLKKDMLVLSVRDYGPGIDDTAQNRVFEPFYTTRQEGTGLGLAIVRGVIHSMNGTVCVNSPSDNGSEFVVTIPRTQQD